MDDNYKGCSDGAVMPLETHQDLEKQVYSSGVKRNPDTGKPRYDLVYKPALKRWALLMARGVLTHGEDNWKKACMPEDLKRFLASANRHFEQYMAGETDEDHMAAVMFNMSGAEYVKANLGIIQE